jgi:hypothetical protein
VRNHLTLILGLPSPTAGATYKLVASMLGDGGTESNGVVRMTKLREISLHP